MPLKFLFVHQNFPGQYRHLAPALAERGHQIVGLGETPNVARQRELAPGINLFGYRMPAASKADPGPFLKSFHQHVERGRVAARAAGQLRAKGFVPDLIGAHIGWGEALFLREIFPESRILLFCEYFYQHTGGDFGFDPQIRTTPESALRLRMMNAHLLMAMSVCDRGITATKWQKSRFPAEFQQRLSVIHDGIDTARVKPDPDAAFTIPGTEVTLTRNDQVVTYTTRNFEPYRGFHIFMRAVPQILAQCPQALIVIVGNDEVSYSPRLPEGRTYRQMALAELGGKLDPARVFFAPSLPYPQYLSLLQVSSAHVYLTYPFVLSWSMLEAMAAGCVVVGSDTAPVTEVIRDGENGLLTNFFDPKAIAARVAEALGGGGRMAQIRARARQHVVERYDLHKVCIGRHVALAEDMARAGGTKKTAGQAPRR